MKTKITLTCWYGGHPPALRRWTKTIEDVVPCADELQFGSRIAERDPKRPSRLSITTRTATLAFTCRAYNRECIEHDASVLSALGFVLVESER